MRRRGNRKWLSFLGTALTVFCVIGWQAIDGEAVDVSGRFGGEIVISDEMPPLNVSRLSFEIALRG